MMIALQYGPIFASDALDPFHLLLPFDQTHHCFAAAIDIRPGIEGILEDAVDSVVSGRAPYYLT